MNIQLADPRMTELVATGTCYEPEYVDAYLGIVAFGNDVDVNSLFNAVAALNIGEWCCK